MATQNIKKPNNSLVFLDNYFNIILAAALILFLFLAYLVLLGPKFRATQAAISANTEEKRLLYEMTQKKLTSLKAISEIYQKINPADLQKFNSVLPDNYVRERLFGELEEIIGRGGWLVSSINISSEETGQAAPAPLAVDEDGQPIPAAPSVLDNKAVGTISLHFNIAAIDYQGFKNLLRILENNLRLFDVTDVGFSSESSAATFVVTTYYYRPL